MQTIQSYWRKRDKLSSFLLYFTQCDGWQHSCHRLPSQWSAINACTSPEQFKSIAKELLAVKNCPCGELIEECAHPYCDRGIPDEYPTEKNHETK